MKGLKDLFVFGRDFQWELFSELVAGEVERRNVFRDLGMWGDDAGTAFMDLSAAQEERP